MTDQTHDDFPSEEEWEAQRRAAAMQQGLDPDDPNQVPEDRTKGPIAAPPITGEVQQRLQDSGSPLASNAPAHGYEEAKRAHSEAQKRKAAKNSLGAERMFPGAYCVIDNPSGDGSEHNGRSVAVNGVNEWESVEEERIAAAGTPSSRFAKVKTYDCSTRDGRAEHLVVSAEHLKKVDVRDFHRSVT